MRPAVTDAVEQAQNILGVYNTNINAHLQNSRRFSSEGRLHLSFIDAICADGIPLFVSPGVQYFTRGVRCIRM